MLKPFTTVAGIAQTWNDTLAGKSGVCMSHNPVIPELLLQTWGWPGIRLFVLKGNTPLALLSAMYTGNQWFSLPHMDQSGLWLDQTACERYNITYAQMHAVLQQNLQSCKPLPESGISSYCLQWDEATLTRNAGKPIVKPLSVRSIMPVPAPQESGKLVSVLSLDPLLDVWAQWPSGPARKARKALRNGLEVSTGGAGLLPDFYAVYRRNIRRLGSLGLPPVWFSNLVMGWKHGICLVVVVYYLGKPVGSALLLTYGGYAENQWFATLPEANRHYAAYLLHATMMQHALEAGCTRYSFGRSTRNGGVHRFKQQFGGTDYPLYTLPQRAAQSRIQSTGFALLRPLLKVLPLALAPAIDFFAGKRLY